MDPEDLRILVAGDHHKAARPCPAVLARLSGHPEDTLLRALPELTPGDPAESVLAGPDPMRQPGIRPIGVSLNLVRTDRMSR